MPHRKDVDMFVVQVALAVADMAGVARAGLLAGLRIDARKIQVRSTPVGWDTFIELLARIEARVGGEGEYERLFEHAWEATPEYTEVAPLFVTPRRLLHFFADVICPPLWACVAFALKDLDDRRAELVLRSPEEYRDGHPLWIAGRGVLRAMPMRLRLPKARVDATMEPHAARYVIHFPEAHAIPPEEHLAALEAFASLAYAELARHADAIRRAREAKSADLEHALDRAHARWRLTPREREVLGYVLHGFANKEIAAHLGCAEITIENHVSRLLRKATARGRVELVSRVWRE